ncbi:MAG: hypothetical protein OXC07_09500 [Kistimonas sp.]|nr:hypothetical protein [Kistimonas sp.]
MLLLEIYSGKLMKTVVPLENPVIFSGATKSSGTEEAILVPDYLDASSSIKIHEENGHAFFETAARGKRKKHKMKHNVIYRVQDLLFFAYGAGNRNPKDLLLKAKRHLPILSLILLINVAASSMLIAHGIKSNEKLVREFLLSLPLAYIKNGLVYINSDHNTTAPIPWGLRNQVVRVAKADAIVLPSLFLDLKQADGKKPVSASLTEIKNHAVLQVKTYEKMFAIAKLLNRKKIAFSVSEGVFFVSNPEKMKGILHTNSIEYDKSLFKKKHSSLNLIDKDDFLYDIHISSSSVPFLVRNNTRYWKGSSVPEYGKIIEFDEDAIIFLDEHDERFVYLLREAALESFQK